MCIGYTLSYKGNTLFILTIISTYTFTSNYSFPFYSSIELKHILNFILSSIFKLIFATIYTKSIDTKLCQLVKVSIIHNTVQWKKIPMFFLLFLLLPIHYSNTSPKQLCILPLQYYMIFNVLVKFLNYFLYYCSLFTSLLYFNIYFKFLNYLLHFFSSLYIHFLSIFQYLLHVHWVTRIHLVHIIHVSWDQVSGTTILKS